MGEAAAYHTIEGRAQVPGRDRRSPVTQYQRNVPETRESQNPRRRMMMRSRINQSDHISPQTTRAVDPGTVFEHSRVRDCSACHIAAVHGHNHRSSPSPQPPACERRHRTCVVGENVPRRSGLRADPEILHEHKPLAIYDVSGDPHLTHDEWVAKYCIERSRP